MYPNMAYRKGGGDRGKYSHPLFYHAKKIPNSLQCGEIHG